MSSLSKTHRLIDLLAVLSSRHTPVTLQEILDRVPGYALRLPDGSERSRASAVRAFERDKDDLRSLGAPIETVEIPGAAGSENQAGYRLRERDFYLPYLRLLQGAAGGKDAPGPTDPPGTNRTRSTRWPGRSGEQPRRWSTSAAGSSGAAFEIREAEATAALEGLAHLCALPGFPLARHARAAFRKLALDLDPLDLLGPGVLTPRPPGTPVPGTRMETLVRGVIDGKRLSFRYRGVEKKDHRNRTVEPYGLFTRFGRWYLAARDPELDGVRVFRADRMDEVSVKPGGSGGPDFDVPDDFDLSALAGRDPWELDRTGRDPREVSMRFHTDFARWAARRRLGVELGDDDDGSAVGSRSVHSPEALVRFVLGLAGGVEVVEPPDVVAAVRDAAARVAELHGEAGGGHGSAESTDAGRRRPGTGE